MTTHTTKPKLNYRVKVWRGHTNLPGESQPGYWRNGYRYTEETANEIARSLNAPLAPGQVSSIRCAAIERITSTDVAKS